MKNKNDETLYSENAQNEKSPNKSLNSHDLIINNAKNFVSQEIPVSRETLGSRRNSLVSPKSIKTQILSSSFKQRLHQKLNDLSSNIIQLKSTRNSSTKRVSLKTRPSNPVLNTKYAVLKHDKYADDTEVFQIIRYLKKFEPSSHDYKRPGLKSFVRLPNGVIVPMETVGDHQR